MTFTPQHSYTACLFILFLVLKLTHVIAWGWFWVLSPLWISACLTFGGVGGVVLVIVIVALAMGLGERVHF
jgi:hypothetical protein